MVKSPPYQQFLHNSRCVQSLLLSTLFFNTQIAWAIDQNKMFALSTRIGRHWSGSKIKLNRTIQMQTATAVWTLSITFGETYGTTVGVDRDLQSCVGWHRTVSCWLVAWRAQQRRHRHSCCPSTAMTERSEPVSIKPETRIRVSLTTRIQRCRSWGSGVGGQGSQYF